MTNDQAQFKLFGNDIMARELISHYLRLLENKETSDSIVPLVFQCLDILIQTSDEAKSHYIESMGEEIVGQWETHENEQV